MQCVLGSELTQKVNTKFSLKANIDQYVYYPISLSVTPKSL